MSNHNIYILITVLNPIQLINCTLVFDTIRKGFPLSKVVVTDNSNSEEVSDYIRRRCKDTESYFEEVPTRLHHADWIERVVKYQKGPAIILDGDVIFFDDCEDFQYYNPLKGYYIPIIFNEWSRCISYPRLHTSFLMIQDCQALHEGLKAMYPPAYYELPQYSPLRPFHPTVVYYHGQPQFYDTCSVLFNMTGGESFCEDERRRYAHINSASFYDEMLKRTANKEAFKIQHEHARNKDFGWFTEWYKAEDAYYSEMNKKASEIISKLQQQENQKTQ